MASFPMKLERVTTLRGHTDRVWSAAWSPGGSYLLTTSSDTTARVWVRRTANVQTVPSSDASPEILLEPTPSAEADVKEEWECLQVLEGVHQRTVRCGSWSPTGRYIALASFDRSISIWELVDGVFECVTTLEGHQEGNEIKWATWAPSGDLLASCARDKTVNLWSNEGGDGDWECVSSLAGHTQDVKQVRFHPHHEMVASVSYDNTAKLWVPEEDDWYCAATLSMHSDTVWALVFSPDAHMLATVSADRSLVVCRHTGDAAHAGARAWPVTVRASELHARPVYSVDWSRPAPLDGLFQGAAGEAAAWCHGSQCLSSRVGMIATVGGDDAISVLLPVAAAPADVQAEPAPDAASNAAATVPMTAPKLPASAASKDGPAHDEALAVVKAARAVAPSPYSAPFAATFNKPRFFAATEGATVGGTPTGAEEEDEEVDGAVPLAGFAVAARVEGAHKGEINCAVWHPKRRNLLATVSDDKTVTVWRLVPA